MFTLSHVLFVVALLMISGGIGAAIAFTPRRRRTTLPPNVIDYSAARKEKLDWLGDRYLLHTPVNRRRS